MTRVPVMILAFITYDTFDVEDMTIDKWATLDRVVS